jgi:tRNA 5-methylaminomethyl-2-thiouridine biosynthesis bifunctional protein
VTPAPTGSAEPVDSAASLRRLLSPAWRNRARFVVLDGVFGGGQHFLECWQAWQHDANRCDRLHVISVSQQFALDPDCAHPLAGAVRDAWPTLTPNIHRLSFEDGRVQWLLVPLSLAAALRELVAEIDAFWLSRSEWAGTHGCVFDPRLAKALARLAAAQATLSFDAQPANPADDPSPSLRPAGFMPVPSQDAQHPSVPNPWRYAPSYTPRRSVGPRHQSATDEAPQVLVVGGGLAGGAMAWALAEQGLRSTVFERHQAPALETSGNPAGLFHGIVNPQDGAHARFNRAAALEAHRAVSTALTSHAVQGSADGLLRRETAPLNVDNMRDMLERLRLPPDYVQALSAQQASARCGWPLPHPAWWYPGGGWVQPGGLARSFFERAGAMCTLRTGTQIDALEPVNGGWRLLDAKGSTLAEAPHVVLANAGDALRLLRPFMPASQPDAWPMRAVRGQISIASRARLPGLTLPSMPVTGSGYLLPCLGDDVIFGATAQTDDEDASVRDADHLLNLHQLSRLCGVDLGSDTEGLRGRTGWRWSTDDRLPVLGGVPDLNAAWALVGLEQPRQVPRLAGLHACTAFGSRGITWAALSAQIVAASIARAPSPIEASLLDSVDAARFVSRRSRRHG